MEDISESVESTNDAVADYEELVDLTSRIFGDQLQFRSAGIEVRGWTPNRASGAVEMRVASDPNVAQRYMDETYGPGRVLVAEVAKAPASLMEPRAGN